MNEWTRKIRRFLFRFWQLIEKILRKIHRQLFPAQAASISSALPACTTAVLKNQVIVITGSSRGIGYVLAQAFLKEGARVVINGRNPAALEEARRKLQNISNEILAVPGDVGQEADVARLVQQAVQKFSKIDVLINNAATPGPENKKIWDLGLQEWEEALRFNVTAPFLCTREIIRWGIAQKHPVRVINVSSGIVGYGAANLGAYNVTKTALEGLSVAVAADAGGDGLISIVNIVPRSVRTEMTKGYFSAVDYELMDDPQVLVPVFLHAASATVGEIMGKTFSEPRFSADSNAETVLNGPVAGFPTLKMQPETFKQKLHETGEENGGYMHLLQNPFGVYPSVVKVVQENFGNKQIYRYPDPSYQLLRAALAKHHQLDSNAFTFGTGSSELIMRAIRLFGGDKGKVIVTRPTWGSVVWPTIIKAGLIPMDVPMLGSVKTKDLRHNLEGILRAIDCRTRLVYLVNPCNPTGSMVGKADLKEFLGRVPSHVTVLLDEAYIDYTEPEKRFNLASVLSEFSCRVIGLRTFSKFFALSGMRVGYAYSTPATINLLDRWDVPFNLSAMAHLAAHAALMDQSMQEKVYQNNFDQRRRMYQKLDELKIDYMPTQTSFILFDCPMDRNRMRADLQKEGIYMPNVDAVVGDNYAVIPVGLPEHNERILNYFSKH
jgi:histidinol-phosphate aminotransferase